MAARESHTGSPAEAGSLQTENGAGARGISTLAVHGGEPRPKLPGSAPRPHVFVNYVRGGDIKRAHRGNVLKKNDARRLAKLMSDPTANDEVEQEGNSAWVDFVDDIAFGLGFVKYDPKGVYAGYTSEAPSFPDNFIEIQAKSYDAYLEMSLAGQESVLLQALLERYTESNCELFHPTMFSRLDRFSSWGSATGVIPTIDFPNVRHPAQCVGRTADRRVVEHRVAGRLSEEASPLFPDPREAANQEQVGDEYGSVRQLS